MKTVDTDYSIVQVEERLKSSVPDLQTETSTNTSPTCSKTQVALAQRVVVYLSNGTCKRNDLVLTYCFLSVYISA